MASSMGIIDLECVRERIEMTKKQEILSKHPYDIWEKDAYCYTYLPDATKKYGRRQIKRKGKDGRTARKCIEDAIIEFYKQKQKEEEEKNNRSKTFKEMYKKWLVYKGMHTDSSAYIRRITNDWNRFYDNDEIAGIPVDILSTLYLDNWIHSVIKKYKLNKKQFYNMSIILRQTLDYCVKIGCLECNPFEKVQINKKMLKDNPRKDDATQIFTVEEEPEIIAYEWEKFENSLATVHLGIILAFKLGLRVGELSALRISDFNKDKSYVHIHAMEITEYDTDDGEHFYVSGRRVVDYTKTISGIRDVYVPLEARSIIETIIKTNKRMGYWGENFLFIRKDGSRYPTYSFTKSLLLACEHENIPQKSMHKIRKTYISALIDGNINISEISKMVGHADKRTTLKSYCYNRFTQEQTENSIENALNF